MAERVRRGVLSGAARCMGVGIVYHRTGVTCTSTPSGNAPHAYASRSRFTLTLIRNEVKSTVYFSLEEREA